MSIKIENVEVVGWEAAIRGMRNPKNSHDRMDSNFHARRDIRYQDSDVIAFYDEDGNPFMMDGVDIGPNDHKLMMSLAKGGPVHAKYRRMIMVYMDITAPLYWWKEFDTYKVGTVANSCSTMHKIHDKAFTQDDFSHEHLFTDDESLEFMRTAADDQSWSAIDILNATIVALNEYRQKFLETNDKKYWWQMIQLLPSSYNQKRTVMMSYEVLANMHDSREFHKLDCWRDLCRVIETLPYSELITGDKN